MDSYPEDMLVGFFPLVFAVDSILTSDHANADDQDGRSSPRRSLFDRFLDALAASLIDETEEVDSDSHRRLSLFRHDELENSSDDEEFSDYFLGAGTSKRRSGALSAGFYAGFGRRSLTQQNESSGNRPRAASYAKALTNGQGFFQRARIVPVSAKYGFPPSKDPEGTNNLAHALSSVHLNRRKAEKESALGSLLQQHRHSLNGIIPSGWLEKHVHALPSVILVVCTVCSSQRDQDVRDRHLFETIEHLQFSLVPKRECTIQVVGLMEDNVSEEQGGAWSQAIVQHFALDESAHLHVSATVLRASSDLACSNTDLPTSQALKQLHRATRDASLVYYLRQARRTKDKLVKLTEDRRRRGRGDSPPIQLSPLMVRYCFKIAIFYEFQMKHEKSLRFLAEAYRHVAKYYQWLISRRGGKADSIDEQNYSIPPDNVTAATSVGSDSMDGSVEVELNAVGHSDEVIWARVVPSPPNDMIHQCRAVADWLNLKLLSAGFASHTEGGLLAAANQWRQHSRVFCTRRHSRELEMDDWFQWSYIARQRIVMSQLVERHPPKALGDLGNEFDEVVLRCSPWRAYESAAEAMLRLGREIEKSKERGEVRTIMDHSERSDSMRPRYVGGLGSGGLLSDFADECKVKHREKALDFILRAISMFERELEKSKRGFYAEDSFSEGSSSRTGARLYYLAAGILLGMARHQEAATHLIKAARYSKGWRELELAARRMLIECYEKQLPSQSESESSQSLVSMILDSYFNAEMSPRDLRRALHHFASISGDGSLKWYHESVNEEDSSLPFSFAVSFPGKTHATAGDTVKASVMIKSNLDYAVQVNSVSLVTLAGDLSISANDLLSAANASEGAEGGIIIQAKTAIIVSTSVDLPKDLSVIASDDTGNGGELQGVAGKGSFAKSARPRTAGITSAGGARLVSEEKLIPGHSSSQGWNVRFLGGKPLLCDGMRLTFYPVQAELASGSPEEVTLIELTIRKKASRTAANIKRTPFEEENYISSAWSRPRHLPLSRGPRSLRVLGPTSQMMITNITEETTNGKAFEGTVNRILLKLQAGQGENCSDVTCDVSCFSVLLTPDGLTKRLVSERELTDQADNSVNMKNPAFRTPVLVSPSSADCNSATTDYGYELPKGWKVGGSGQGDCTMSLPSMKGGESAFVHVDLFRPPALTQKVILSAGGAEDLGDVSICKTDFYVTLRYRQQRPSAQKRKISRRASRRRPVRSMVGKNEESVVSDANVCGTQVEALEETDDEVSLEYTGSVVWATPLSATFSPGSPSQLRSKAQDVLSKEVGEELTVVDGETVSLRCSLQLDPSMDGLQVEIASVHFEDNADPDSSLAVSLSSENSTTLYKSAVDDPCRMLSVDSKFGIGYSVVARLKNQPRGRGTSSTLGSVLVDWLPSTLELPDEPGVNSSALGDIRAHGPLALRTPSRIRFMGPRCFVNSAPVEAELIDISHRLSVGTPFELTYRIRNKSCRPQMVTACLRDGSDGENDAARRSFVVSGLISGDLSLGPLEERLLSFTAIPTRAGEASLPLLELSSSRDRSVVFHKGTSRANLFVLP